ncbi:TraM recognition domain-containing protein [Calycomorphotria hydatis]|nr:type IV secretory system conjugative DNA transfer family protein [Calycomorphotria hydatis]
MLQTRSEKSCIFVIDPLGNLSQDLLTLIAHPRYSTDSIRERLVYIEPAREDVVLPFNPLLHSSEGNRYYQTMRGVDIILRAWAAQNVSEQPRLLQWTYKAFCAVAMMQLPIAMCRYLLHPGTEEHAALLQRIPGDIRYHWQEILSARGNEAVRILESTRNRLDPFFESTNLRRMFGVVQSRFDCERFIRERKIVVLNLASRGVIPSFVSHTIGALALNEMLETASRMVTTQGRHTVDPTYIVMDEFQNYVSPDVEEALPTVRQMGLRLILAHQSFSQLEREDIDLTNMIWQARSRLIFNNTARDADIVADELAKRTFDSMTVKHKLMSMKQLITGYRKEWLRTVSTTDTASTADMAQDSTGTGESKSETVQDDVFGYSRTAGHNTSSNYSKGLTRSSSTGRTEGSGEVNVPIHKTFREVSGITFESFDEFVIKWGQWIRNLKTGEAYLQVANEDHIRKIQVDYQPIEDSREMSQAVEELKEQNFSSDFFISAHEADQESEQCRRQLLSHQPIVLPGTQSTDQATIVPPPDAGEEEDGVQSEDPGPFTL